MFSRTSTLARDVHVAIAVATAIAPLSNMPFTAQHDSKKTECRARIKATRRGHEVAKHRVTITHQSLHVLPSRRCARLSQPASALASAIVPATPTLFTDQTRPEHGNAKAEGWQPTMHALPGPTTDVHETSNERSHCNWPSAAAMAVAPLGPTPLPAHDAPNLSSLAHDPKHETGQLELHSTVPRRLTLRLGGIEWVAHTHEIHGTVPNKSR